VSWEGWPLPFAMFTKENKRHLLIYKDVLNAVILHLAKLPQFKAGISSVGNLQEHLSPLKLLSLTTTLEPRLIVKFNANTSSSEADSFCADLKTRGGKCTHRYYHVFHGCALQVTPGIPGQRECASGNMF
jgi:hypothetical protein